MPKKIVGKEAKILRAIAKEVPIAEIKTAKIQTIVKEMKEALASQDDGVAIAAPQIGYSLRIFVVSGRVGEMEFESKPTSEEVKVKIPIIDSVYINPVIKKASKEKHFVEEGCLSVRYLYGQVKRSKKATIEAYDESGKKISRGGSGLMAQIFQHETDHLNGILFIDKAKDIEEIPPAVQNKLPVKDEGK